MESQPKVFNSKKTIKKKLIIEEDNEIELLDKIISENNEMSYFVNQITRKDVLNNMLLNPKLGGKNLFKLIIKENNPLCEDRDETREGWLYETFWEIIIILKCVENINYSEILAGQLDNLKKITNINELLKCKVSGGGNNISDMTIRDGETLIPFTIKYKNKFSETDVSKINNKIVSQNISTNYKIGLIVKDKEVIKNHKYKNKLNIDKQMHDEIIKNGLLFDEEDLIRALDVFCERFNQNELIDDFIEKINSEYLLSPTRQLLRKKLHQRMSEMMFINSVSKNKHNMFVIGHKPRSGKSITILLDAKNLLENGYNKILIMTAVADTIKNFVEDLTKYINFKNINYKLQNEFDTVDEAFIGIVFCSVQYLKIDGKNKITKDILKNIGFDAIITDECHLGGSTDKTKTNILDINPDIDEIRANIKLSIFASGTPDKTIKYYGIPSSCLSLWEMEDEGYMKELEKPNLSEEVRENIINYMSKRHGPLFMECLHDNTLNKDYSKHPTQVLMKHTIPQSLIDEINDYNLNHGTKYGYSCSSLFALRQFINDKGEVEYDTEFELCNTSDGISILKSFFECIISKNKNNNSTIIKQIENTQSSYKSRMSTDKDPLLIIMYCPTHTGNNKIDQLQQTIVKFLNQHKLWCEYNIAFSNSNSNTGNASEDYNSFIETIKNNAKKDNKIGSILLLGNKGSVGITYHDCDVTISLDDGHNLDNYKQRLARSLTEAPGKTIGINVDMNIQRSYLFVIDLIQKYRKNTKTTKTNAEILYYLYEHNIFKFDPQQFNNGKVRIIEIMSFYQKESEKIIASIDDTILLENIICDDDMRDFIKTDFKQKITIQKINNDLEGEQQNCPKGDKTKYNIDAPDDVVDKKISKEEEEEEEETKQIEILTNQTLEMCKGFLIPTLALISRSSKIVDFKELFVNEETKALIFSLLKDKKIELEISNYNIVINIMNHIMDNNSEIINNIREIYATAPSHKIRDLIEKHFIPTVDEKVKNAEVPTPRRQVDAQLNNFITEFWETPKKLMEPCCGKGNFVLGMFDYLYNGLENLYPDNEERCRVTLKNIYYADLTALNVFITTEILKCHIQSYCGVDDFVGFVFNGHVGDTLELDIKQKWNVDGFDAVIGNPPYNSNGDTSTGNTIWQSFTTKALEEWLLPNGYLSFIHPPGWRKPSTNKGKFAKMFDLMSKQNQMIYLEIHGIEDGKKLFNCGTRYDWYLIQKIPQYKNTIVKDCDGVVNEINLVVLNWLPNNNIEKIMKLINKPEKIKILCDFSYSRLDKKVVSVTESEQYKYPLIYLTPKKGVRRMYSNVNNKGHFGISKVIIGETGMENAINDYAGEYGMTQDSFGIIIKTQEEGDEILKAVNNPDFIELVRVSCSWSNFRIDYRLFKDFNEDFWKEFL